MLLLKELSENDVIYSTHLQADTRFTVRKAARAVLLNAQQQVALLYVGSEKYHKLPGGGIESGESVFDALKREVMEETGHGLQLAGEVGMIIEYRNQQELLQLSYCYLAQSTGAQGVPSFTDEETNQGFELRWLPLSAAIDLLEREAPEDYTGRFIRLRDWHFLRQASSHVGKR